MDLKIPVRIKLTQSRALWGALVDRAINLGFPYKQDIS
jgi:hypothetical protein